MQFRIVCDAFLFFFRSKAFANSVVVVFRMGNCCCYVVGPDEAMVITGGCFSDAKRQIIGGFGCACPCWSDVTVLPLNIMTLVPSVQQCETKQGRLLLNNKSIMQFNVRILLNSIQFENCNV